MTTLMSKSSVYDFLSMILPGYLLIVCIVYPSTEWRHVLYDDKLPSIVVALVLSYIIGMVIHCISKVLFDPILRNNPYCIKKMRCLFLKNLKSYRNGALDRYYRAYYKALFKSSIPILEAQVSFLRSMSIVVLVAIIRLCFLDEQIFFIPNCRAAILFLLLLFVMVYMMCKRQLSVYYRVWEDEHYIRATEKK